MTPCIILVLFVFLILQLRTSEKKALLLVSQTKSKSLSCSETCHKVNTNEVSGSDRKHVIHLFREQVTWFKDTSF